MPLLFSLAPSDIYCLCSQEKLRSWCLDEGLVIASFDPGVKNLGVRIEIRSRDKIVPLFFRRVNLLEDDLSGNDLITTAQSLEKLFKEIDPLLSICHLICIERQQPISNKMMMVQNNSKVMKVYGFLIGVFMLKYNSHAIILDINPKLKGKALMFPAGLTYAQTKAYSVKTAVSILNSFSDKVSLDYIKTLGAKKDDVCDAFCQLEAVSRALLHDGILDSILNIT